jgi:hypothetical protein
MLLFFVWFFSFSFITGSDSPSPTSPTQFARPDLTTVKKLQAFQDLLVLGAESVEESRTHCIIQVNIRIGFGASIFPAVNEQHHGSQVAIWGCEYQLGH